AIPSSAKRLAISMLIASGLILVVLDLPWMILVACLGLFLAIGIFIVSRPVPAAQPALSANPFEPFPLIGMARQCETIRLYQGSRVYADIRAYSDPEAYHE